MYRDFHLQKSDFITDVNTMLEITAKEMNELRKDEAARLYRSDLLDTNLVRIEYDLNNENGPMVSLIDAKTNNPELSVVVTNKNMDSITQEYLFDRLEFTVFRIDANNSRYYGSFIGERASSYYDTLSINIDLFEEKLNQRLSNRSIRPDYKTVVLPSDSNFVATSDKGIVSSRYKFHDGGFRNDVLVYFEDPELNILQRSIFILLSCFIVLVITAVSFYLLVRSIQKEKKLGELKDDFIDGMTHELLTPISTLKLALESLEKSEAFDESGRSKNYLKVSKMELSRINDIVQNVLYSSLHQQNELKLSIERVNLNELIDSLINYHKTRTQAHLEISFKGLEDPYVTSDAQHLTNVFHNLLDNAIKYASSERIQVDIVARRFEEEVSIVFNDNGRGIADEFQANIFEKFYRIPSENQEVNGLGIGLHYVRTILENLNGKIELLHSSDKGSSFRVSLSTTNKHG